MERSAQAKERPARQVEEKQERIESLEKSRAPDCRRVFPVDKLSSVRGSLPLVDAYLQAGLDALGDATRMAIFQKLANGPIAVNELARTLPVSRPAVSQHLRVLKNAGLVTDSKAGTRRLYQLNPEGVARLRAHFDQMWTKAMSAFQEPRKKNHGRETWQAAWKKPSYVRVCACRRRSSARSACSWSRWRRGGRRRITSATLPSRRSSWSRAWAAGGTRETSKGTCATGARCWRGIRRIG